MQALLDAKADVNMRDQVLASMDDASRVCLSLVLFVRGMCHVPLVHEAACLELCHV